MEETKTKEAEKGADASKPLIHRVCEGCNNMFATHAGSKELRCPNCRKE
jgi:LSD1 subclass zinc finger protein